MAIFVRRAFVPGLQILVLSTFLLLSLPSLYVLSFPACVSRYALAFSRLSEYGPVHFARGRGIERCAALLHSHTGPSRRVRPTKSMESIFYRTEYKVGYTCQVCFNELSFQCNVSGFLLRQTHSITVLLFSLVGFK